MSPCRRSMLLAVLTTPPLALLTMIGARVVGLGAPWAVDRYAAAAAPRSPRGARAATMQGILERGSTP